MQNDRIPILSVVGLLPEYGRKTALESESSRRIRRKLLTSILCSYCNRRFSVTTVRFATTAPAKAMLPIVAKPPSFLERLRAILDAPSNEHVIRWVDNGLQFEVRQPKLMHEILPNYFKHSNLSSFQRQLNYFGFHKVAPCGEGVLLNFSMLGQLPLRAVTWQPLRPWAAVAPRGRDPSTAVCVRPLSKLPRRISCTIRWETFVPAS